MRWNVILLSIMVIGCAGKDEGERQLSPYLDSDQDGFAETEDCNDRDPAEAWGFWGTQDDQPRPSGFSFVGCVDDSQCAYYDRPEVGNAPEREGVCANGVCTYVFQ